MRTRVLAIVAAGALPLLAGQAVAKDRVIHPSREGTAQICGGNTNGCNWCNSQHCYVVDSCGQKTCNVKVLREAPSGPGPRSPGPTGLRNSQPIKVSAPAMTNGPSAGTNSGATLRSAGGGHGGHR